MSKEAKLDTLTRIASGLVASGRYHYVTNQETGDPDNPDDMDVPCLDKEALLDDTIDIYGALTNLASQIDSQEALLHDEALLAYSEKISKKCACKPKVPPKPEPPSTSISA